MSIEGKKIIITGGATGYGYGDARALKAAGGEVWIVGRRLERLRKAAEELGVRFIQGDITRGEDWDRIMETVGEVDILVNNAGVAVKVEPLLSFSDEEIFRSINGNLTGAILGCRRVAEKMVARKSGLIINVTSVCSHYGWPGFACYTAAKAGLDMFSRAQSDRFCKTGCGGYYEKMVQNVPAFLSAVPFTVHARAGNGR